MGPPFLVNNQARFPVTHFTQALFSPLCLFKSCHLSPDEHSPLSPSWHYSFLHVSVTRLWEGVTCRLSAPVSAVPSENELLEGICDVLASSSLIITLWMLLILNIITVSHGLIEVLFYLLSIFNLLLKNGFEYNIWL